MRIPFFIALFFCAFSSFSINKKLAFTVDSMVEIEQKWRLIAQEVLNNKIDTIDEQVVMQKIANTDVSNGKLVKQLFLKHSFLGYDLVGEESSHNFWLLVQHQDRDVSFQELVLNSMKEQVEQKNASAVDFAYLFDRIRMNKGQKQYYGTQYTINEGATSFEVMPIEDLENVDSRRKLLGLESIADVVEQLNESSQEQLIGLTNKNK